MQSLTPTQKAKIKQLKLLILDVDGKIGIRHRYGKTGLQHNRQIQYIVPHVRGLFRP
jgi:hypothetical protein